MGGKLSYYLAVALSGACLGLAAVSVATSRGNRAVQQQLESQSQEAQAKQAELQARAQAIQNEMQNLANTEQIGRGILADMGSAAVSNEAMRALLAKHGYTLKPVNATNAVAPAAPPAPVSTSATTPAAKAEVVSAPVGFSDAAKGEGVKGDKP